MDDKSMTRIFLPHTIWTSLSGVMVGTCNKQERLYCVTSLQAHSYVSEYVSKKSKSVVLGLWKNTLHDPNSEINSLDLQNHIHESLSWFILEKKCAGLPKCTFMNTHERDNVLKCVVIVYDAQCLQKSYYLMDLAYMNMNPGAVDLTQGLVHEPNVKHLCSTISLSSAIGQYPGTRSLVCLEERWYHAVGTHAENFIHAALESSIYVCTSLFKNRYWLFYFWS